ncbi:MAG: type II toxin-antitoxin system HicA family toxin [Candidatus Gracilibacteria bacterium]|nr:type II toxin-antitoxin system HicA family toxin [Candidatus Gracilibacteria bacterium]
MVKSDYKYISGKELIKILASKNSLEVISQKGSHIKVIVNGIKTIIPNHKELAYGTYSSILKQLQIDEKDLLQK